ncbi:MAG: hypothetical protein DME89_01330 [Verrucomicrobia bacterium]|nr:MAG: hypothetical protein DME89_01330 [Verrucomicrobiota bacterium]
MLSCLDASGNPLSFAIVLYQSETAKLNLWMPSHFPLVTESITRLAASANRVPDCRNSTHNLAKYSLSHLASNISEKLHFFILMAYRTFYRSNRRFLRFRGLPQS